MRSLYPSLVAISLLFNASLSLAGRLPSCAEAFVPTCDKRLCCHDMGGINYCDSSAGRYVCNNGYYSSCYCTRHAVMDMQKFEGCCLWQNGVFRVDETGLVICNNGGVSAVCSLQPQQTVSVW
ncbi:hypothetical protein [Legionella fairfieldensis]|uniref:hypothetical protein n=1 Tax=Legionella fairfieldensis TaxID=45064 RepID=UPI0006862379|nr:hypothetical protein [Legionella fairfieldensis]